MRRLWDAIWYNAGKGPSDGNNYWRRFTAAHYVYVGLGLLLMSCAAGLSALFIGAVTSGARLVDLWPTYWSEPLIILLNVLPVALLTCFFYFLTGRAWAAFFLSAAPCIILSVVDFYKITIRAETLVASDLGLVHELAGIISNYTITLSGRACLAIAAIVTGTVAAAVFMRGKLKNPWVRVSGSVLSLAALLTVLFTVCFSDGLYGRIINEAAAEEVDMWVEQNVFTSKGFLYSFLHSVPDAFPSPPDGYSDELARQALADCDDAAIDPEKRVNIIAVMFEAYADLSEFDEVPVYDSVYGPLHELEAESLHGHVLANVYGGGTVDTERNFLTGYPHSQEYRSPTDSYVWYMRENGYYAEGLHPGNSWFYNRENVERNLGMENFYFLDDFPDSDRTDDFFFRTLKKLYTGRDAATPYFNFSVTFQNHGAYSESSTVDTPYLDGEGMSAGTYNILNNYLSGIADTSRRMLDFVDSLRGDEAPVVVVFFGDHQPSLGGALQELGVNMDLGTEDGFYNYYSTPYIIWANDAAKAVTGGSFTGEGGDMSSCFLMTRLFDECGYTGSGYMDLTRRVYSRVTMINTGSIAWVVDGELVHGLEGQVAELTRQLDWAEYYTKRNFSYGGTGRDRP